MDLFQTFPEEIIHQVFQHFNGKDLLRISTVSFSWNDFIGKSKRFAGKLELRIGSDRYNKFTEHDKKLLVLSREYQHVRISEATGMVEYVLDIFSSLNCWKSVTIVETEFESICDFIKFLRAINQTVEILKLYRVTIKNPDELEEAFIFSNLKSLTISSCDELIFTKVFLQCPKLESLEIYNPGKNISNPSSIIDLLKCHKNITKFQTDGKWFNFIFKYENMQNFSFNLKELSVYGSGLLIETIDDNFINFLYSQSTTLESLYLGDCLGCDLAVLQAALDLKALKNLNIFFLPVGLRFAFIDNPKSESIENLDILTVDIDNKDKMKFILKSVPNVKNLRLRTMDEETARFMAENMKSLRKILSVYIKDEKVVRKILPNVKII